MKLIDDRFIDKNNKKNIIFGEIINDMIKLNINKTWTLKDILLKLSIYINKN